MTVASEITHPLPFRWRKIVLKLSLIALGLAGLGIFLTTFFFVAALEPGPDELAGYVAVMAGVAVVVLVFLGAAAVGTSLPLVRVLVAVEAGRQMTSKEAAQAWKEIHLFHRRATILSMLSWVVAALVLGGWLWSERMVASLFQVGLMVLPGILLGCSTSVGFYLSSRAAFRPVLRYLQKFQSSEFQPAQFSTLAGKIYFVFFFAAAVTALALGSLVFLRRPVEREHEAERAVRSFLQQLRAELQARSRADFSRRDFPGLRLQPFLLSPAGNLSAGTISAPELHFLLHHPRFLGRSEWRREKPVQAFLAEKIFARLIPWPPRACLVAGGREMSEGSAGERWLFLEEKPLPGGLLLGAAAEREICPPSWSERVFEAVLVLLVLGLIAAAGLWAGWLAEDVGQPLRGLKEAMEERPAEGEAVAVVETDDEIGALAVVFNRMSRALAAQMSQVEKVLAGGRAAGDRIQQTMKHIGRVVSDQAAASSQHAVTIQQISSTSEEMAASLRLIAESAKSVEDLAGRTLDVCRQGQQHLHQAEIGIAAAVDRAHQAARRMLSLQEQANRIETILDFISELSARLHIISLNAAIEASALGEAGERFGVVAAQMRELAEKTGQGAKESRQLFADLQAATASAIIATEEGEKGVLRTRDLTERASEDFQAIIHWAGETARAAQEISFSSSQQTSATEHLAAALGDIREVAGKLAETARVLEESVEELAHTAEQLHALLEEKPSLEETSHPFSWTEKG